MDRAAQARPWTVYVLTIWTVAGALWGLITSDGNLGLSLLWFVVGMLFARAYWKGARWAFTLTFMLASLCAGLLVTIAIVQAFLLEGPTLRPMLISGATSFVLIALLLHPATKRFARVEAPPAAATVRPSPEM
ncbi:MAG TPA: hypothetical protein VJ927_10785 [Actinomycetota bacterium]|nr:hypothetical protein [Actinomycetota bacterium]